jgi:hypothetical protein
MRNLGMEKVPGSSLIQVGSEVHEFLAKDTRHQKMEEIYEMLDGLISVMKHAEHVPVVTETSVFRIPLLRT